MSQQPSVIASHAGAPTLGRIVQLLSQILPMLSRKPRNTSSRVALRT